jgi:hypothetical protein
MISYDLSIAEIMMLLNQAVIERFKGSISDQFQFNRRKLRRFSV